MDHFASDFGLVLLLAVAQGLAFILWALALGSEMVTLSAMRQAARSTAWGGIRFGILEFIVSLIATALEAIGTATGRLVPAAREMKLGKRLLIFAGAFALVVIFLGVGFPIFLPAIHERGSLECSVRVYGSVLRLARV